MDEEQSWTGRSAGQQGFVFQESCSAHWEHGWDLPDRQEAVVVEGAQPTAVAEHWHSHRAMTRAGSRGRGWGSVLAPHGPGTSRKDRGCLQARGMRDKAAPGERARSHWAARTTPRPQTPRPAARESRAGPARTSRSPVPLGPLRGGTYRDMAERGGGAAARGARRRD